MPGTARHRRCVPLSSEVPQCRPGRREGLLGVTAAEQHRVHEQRESGHADAGGPAVGDAVSS
ncbi:hypothetical protein SVIOM342S_03481 [Streptomyces violaceorubidus]